MKLIVNLQTGNIGITQDNTPVPQKAHLVTHIATPEQEAMLQSGNGPYKWVPADPEEPSGPGDLVAYTPVVPVPERVTPRQFRLALLAAAIDVDAVIAGLPAGAAKEAAKIEWQWATYIERENPLVAQVAAVLELTQTEVDDIFRAAAAS